MTLFDLFVLLPAIFIFITAVARLNDIKKSQVALLWWIRRVGLALLMVSMSLLIASYFTVAGPHWYTIMRLSGIWGLAFTWLTTPNMVPWWNYITKGDPQVLEETPNDQP